MKRALSRKNIWERTPPWVKRYAGAVLGLPPGQYVLGRRFRKTLKFADESQWWSAEQAREYQLSGLRRICALAYERTAYYRREFDRIDFSPRDLEKPEDLEALATIDKNTLRENLDEMCAVPPDCGGIDYVATGGTSGVPLRFYIGSDRSDIEYAYLVASWKRAGYSLKVPQAVFRGQVVQPNRKGLRHEYDPLLRRHHYSNFHMDDESTRRYLEHLATIGPFFYHCYPSSIAALARFVRRSGYETPANARGILVGSEEVYESDRACVEDVFGVRYFSWYGHSEKLVLAAECEHTSNYHVWPTYGYFELLDDEGKAITTPGERGEIAGTGFINKVVPFIRYRTGDYAVYVGDGCKECGREHPIIHKIDGRWPSGELVAADGSLISMTALNVHDDTFEHVRQYQFRQDCVGRAILLLVPFENYKAEEAGRIRKSMDRKLDGRLDLSIEVVDSIAKTPRGKAVWVDQRLNVAELQVHGRAV